jgi:hypothetical protein
MSESLAESDEAAHSAEVTAAERALSWWALSAFVSAPLIVAAVVLAFRPWYPTLDMAMTEYRVRDVGGPDTPLIGLPGRIGNFPDQGSHPGPWSFWLLRPFHLLTGGRSWGMELGSAVLNSICVAAGIAMARRIGGRSLMLAVAAVMAIAIRGYGLSVLTHPWNPYFPVLIWIVVLVATWGVLCGYHRLGLVVVGAGTVAAQTHVPYLLLAIAMSSVVVATLAWRRDRTALVAVVATALVLWSPAFLDQLRNEPGNISMLIDHFTGDTDGSPIGLSGGTEVFLRHLDAPRVLLSLFGSDAAFVDASGIVDGVALGGLLVVMAWVASVFVAFRRKHARLLALHAVLAVALAVGWFSMTRIFGKVWYYLTLWAWGTTLLIVVSIAWTVALFARDRVSEESLRLSVSAVAGAAIVVPTVFSLVASAGLDVPEENLSSGVGGVIDEAEAAIRSGVGDSVGADGTYVVFWQDVNFIGAQGYALVNELERRGLDVGVHPTWRVPVTPQRVIPPGTADAEVHIVSGDFIDEWRARDGYTEVVEFDPLTEGERAEFEELRTDVIERLQEAGRADLVEVIDVNLFGTSLDPNLDDDIVADLDRMLELTAPVAVFIAPPGSTS